jgi:1,2-diacylglycerol 3-beta-galactosyltransferase
MRKTILILTADAGYGHRSAANALAAAVQEAHGSECVAEIVNPLEDEPFPAILRSTQSDYDRLVRQMPELYRLGYEASDARLPNWIVQRALAVMLRDLMREVARHYQPDAVVTTFPIYQAAVASAAARSGRPFPLVNVVTDLVRLHRLWFHSACDLCLVPTETARRVALRQGLPAEKVYVTGIPVHPRLAQIHDDPATIRGRLGWHPDLTTVLAVGSRRVTRLPEVLRALNHSGFRLQLAITAGGDEALYRQLESEEWHTPAHLYHYVRNMPEMLHAADFVICKAGGLMVTEALACGVPLLLTDVLPGQEVGNADYVVRHGAGEVARDPLEAIQVVSHWLASGGTLLKRRARNARRLGRPRAAHEIVERVWALLSRCEPEVHRASSYRQ